jgi:hypothetical protein
MAARWIVEDGLSYAAAKHKAAVALGVAGRQAMPDNDTVEAAVFDYIDTFCADEQAAGTSESVASLCARGCLARVRNAAF